MTRKTKTILFISICGAGIIGFVAYNVVQLMNSFSDKKDHQSSAVLFSLTSEDLTKPQVPENNPASDYEQLRLKQKPYVDGQQRLQEQDTKKQQAAVSFSSIFQQQDGKKKAASSISTRRNSADEALDQLLTKSDRKTSQPRKESYTADQKAYQSLEEDIQSFYSPKRSVSAQSSETKSEAPVSDLERKRRALEDGFQITNSQSAQQLQNSNIIRVATRGNQEVASGQSIKLRVLDHCRYNGIDIPRNTIIDGRVSIANSNRLSVTVTAIRTGQQTHSVELHGYDLYGQAGLPLTIDKGKSIGSEEIGDAVENIARQTVGQSRVGQIVTGTFGALRREGKKTIVVLDAQKLILK